MEGQQMESQSRELIEEIIRLSDHTVERLPMLNIIGERLVDNLAVALAELNRCPNEVKLSSLDYLSIGQAIEEMPEPGLMVAGQGAPFDGEVMIVLDRTFLLTSTELILGGSGRGFDPKGTDRFTAIEVGFGESLAATILSELQRALSVICAARLEIGRVTHDRGKVNLGKSNSLCARMKVTVEQAGHQGHLELILPHDSLEPIRPDLGKVYFGDRSEDSGNWQEVLEAQILRAQMDLEVVLAEESFPIQRILAWQPGDTIDFGIEEGSNALLTCSDQTMFEVSLGKRNNGFAAVQITEKLSLDKEARKDGDDS
jgi:flagellar motor switch protein FliM